MNLSRRQAGIILRCINTEESLDSDHCELILEIAQSFSGIEEVHQDVIDHAKAQLPIAKEREAKNKEHWKTIQEGINRRKK